MIAHEESFTFIKNQNIFIIPFFQRGYVWKEDNWSDLWDELTSEKKDCFLGSIILKDDGEDRNGFHNKMVIDGQQRLTTLSIVIRALNDTDNVRYGRKDISDQFKSFLFFTKDIRTETSINEVKYNKLVPSINDKVYFDNVINGTYEFNYNDVKIDNQIFLCYKFFREKMSSETTEILQRITNKLTIDDRKIIVKIDLTKEENEQVIFDTINSAGVKLTSADIIKNALYQKINELDSSGVYQYYLDTWNKHFEQEDKLKSWLEDRVTGRITRTSIDMFLQAFAIINKFFDPQKDLLQDLPDNYKKKIANMNLQQLKDMIKSLCEYADIYFENFVGFNSTTGLQYSDYKTRLLQILHEIEISTFDAFVLKILKDETNADEQKKVLKELESYVMRNYITSNTTNIKNYNKDSMQIIEDTSKLSDWLKKDDISNEKVKIGLKNIKNDKAKLILFWIQLFRENNENHDRLETTIVYNFELEHVMPQKWSDYWDIKTLPCKQDDKDLDGEEAEEYRSAKIYEIGNMTLLRSKLNKTLKNRCFKDKVDGCKIGKGFAKGMKDNCSFSITTEITSLEVWNENAITARTNKLFGEIVKIWPTVIP